MNTYSVHDTDIELKKIDPKDPDFYVSNGMVLAPRASIEISPECPRSYCDMIVTAYNRGWINPIARVISSEQ